MNNGDLRTVRKSIAAMTRHKRSSVPEAEIVGLPSSETRKKGQTKSTEEYEEITLHEVAGEFSIRKKAHKRSKASSGIYGEEEDEFEYSESDEEVTYTPSRRYFSLFTIVLSVIYP